jgi:hypothetical protein
VTFEEALRERLVTDVALIVLQGTRATWGTRPQGGALPATVLNIVYDPTPTSFEGSEETRATQVQIDVWASLPTVAAQLAGAVIAALLPPVTVGGVQFRRAFVEAHRDAGEQAGDAYLARRIIEMTFWHSLI